MALILEHTDSAYFPCFKTMFKVSLFDSFGGLTLFILTPFHLHMNAIFCLILKHVVSALIEARDIVTHLR